MAEAVIVATGRSAIGRAHKGSLVDVRPDDLAASVVAGVLQKIPQLDPDSIEDLMMGCGNPWGEAGFNIARVVAVLAGLDNVPGVTVNRYSSSSLQTIRMVAHAIRAGEGDVFVAAGVEAVSRYGDTPARNAQQTNPRFQSAMDRTAQRSQPGSSTWARGSGLADVYIAMGQTAENVAQLENVSRTEMDEIAVRSQELAIASQNNGFIEREIIPYDLGNGELFVKDDCPRDGTTLEKLARLKPVFRDDGTLTAGNACALNDGAAAVVVMSDVWAKELGVKPLARIVSSAVSALNPEIM
jgi:acetyl-CoA C-acetyltransferase